MKKKQRKRYRVPVVGLTGGIGSGQSSVGEILRELGAVIINADKIGNDLLDKQPVKKRILKYFSNDILNESGNIDRKKLGKIVFENRRALRRLNALMHPPMIEEVCREVTRALRDRKYKLVVVDAALIFEAGMDTKVDYIVTVYSDMEKRIERIKSRDSLSDIEVKERISSQIPLEYKAEKADYIIENNCTLKSLTVKTRQVFKKILSDFKNSRHRWEY